MNVEETGLLEKKKLVQAPLVLYKGLSQVRQTLWVLCGPLIILVSFRRQLKILMGNKSQPNVELPLADYEYSTVDLKKC